MRQASKETSIEVLEETLKALHLCTQPFGCNSECPFYNDAEAFRLAPEAYCQGRMAGHVSYVLDQLKEADV